MNNRQVYAKDPATRKLVNEGVANVNDEGTDQALAVLRYELETFVCDGQYEKGIEHILATYLRNIGQSQQPGLGGEGAALDEIGAGDDEQEARRHADLSQAPAVEPERPHGIGPADDQAGEADRYLDRREQFGKVVLVP